MSPKLLLPTEAIQPAQWEPWWTASVAYVTEDDVRGCTPAEHAFIDSLIDRGTTLLAVLDRELSCALFRKGLIYINVPIKDDDRVVVPPLEGFVMNRVLGDYFETLLYKIFVSIDEHTTVAECVRRWPCTCSRSAATRRQCTRGDPSSPMTCLFSHSRRLRCPAPARWPGDLPLLNLPGDGAPLAASQRCCASSPSSSRMPSRCTVAWALPRRS